MSMSRKDYEAVANVIHDTLEDEQRPQVQDVIEGLANDLAEVFADANDTFDTSRFLDACGLG